MVITPRTVGPRKLRVLQGSPEWLAARREHVTATDIPALMGISPWKCEADLADAKARKYLVEQMEKHFFGDGADMAQGYVPPKE